MRRKHFLTVFFIGLMITLTIRCTAPTDELDNDPPPYIGEDIPFGTTYIPASPQRDGDPAAGYNYLIYGDYMNAGIPYDAFIQVIGENDENVLNRTGDNAVLPYELTAVMAPSGARIVAQNCLKCHGSKINGEFIIGLGAAHYDYTFDHSMLEPATTAVIKFLYGMDSPEWEAYDPFRRSGKAIGPYLVTEVVGVNPADKIWTILASHRDNWSLEWDDIASLPISRELIPTDVPPWWNLKKKHAMFYSTYGRHDFSRIMMASSLLTLKDSTKAREVEGRFADVYAYLRTIEPPPYPWDINEDLAAEGMVIFNDKCSKCHGTYGENETFPNLLVSLARVGTDKELAMSYYNNPGFVNWFNSGWFSQEPYAALLETHAGYIAPPLDGIWASAPYLHNGSVPTLDDLLNTGERPTYWKRNFTANEYDPVKVGWLYEKVGYKEDRWTYDTTIKGYGNAGHFFGDPLTELQRKAVLEYLKTL